MRTVHVMAALWMAAAGCACGANLEATAGRDWTVQDSLGVRYYVVTNPRFAGTLMPAGFREWLDGDEVAVFSPDRARFFFVSFRGDGAADQVIYELSVFSAQEVGAALGTARKPRPVHTIRFTSAHSDALDAAGIFNPAWENEHSILFTGVNGQETHRIYRLNVDTGALTALSDPAHNVDVMAPFATTANSILYTTREAEEWRPLEHYPRAVVGSKDLWQLIEPKRYFEHMYARYKDAPARLVIRRELGTYQAGPFVSPDGKWAIAITAPAGAQIPEAWQRYERRSEMGLRFILINIQDGTTRTLIDAPAGTVTEAGRGRHVPFAAFWSSDSSHVLLYNTALPLDQNREERTRMSYIVDYDVPQGRWNVLQRMQEATGRRVGTAQWIEGGRDLFVSYEAKGPSPAGTLYRYSNGVWKLKPLQRAPAPKAVQASKRSGLQVSIREDADTPPIIIASSTKGEVALTEPDSTLDGIWRAKAQPVQWSGVEGRKGRGILFLPRATHGAAPRPLVIEVGGYEPDVFRPDGGVSAGYGTQALVAQGFAVLRLDYHSNSPRLTPNEGTDFIANVDAAVDHLSASGTVDRAKVGMVGHSRAGYLTHYMVSHPARTHLEAAIVFDSITVGYGEYVSDAAFGDDARIYEEQYGKGTFWQNKSGWMDAPLFNTERVTTPVLFSATGPTNGWSLIETAGAFRMNQRPFEYHFYFAGAHTLQRPRERAEAMQSTLDWMSFWILSRPPSAPADDLDRPARWERIKRDWDAQRQGAAN